MDSYGVKLEVTKKRRGKSCSCSSSQVHSHGQEPKAVSLFTLYFLLPRLKENQSGSGGISHLNGRVRLFDACQAGADRWLETGKAHLLPSTISPIPFPSPLLNPRSPLNPNTSSPSSLPMMDIDFAAYQLSSQLGGHDDDVRYTLFFSLRTHTKRISVDFCFF